MLTPGASSAAAWILRMPDWVLLNRSISWLRSWRSDASSSALKLASLGVHPEATSSAPLGWSWVPNERRDGRAANKRAITGLLRGVSGLAMAVRTVQRGCRGAGRSTRAHLGINGSRNCPRISFSFVFPSHRPETSRRRFSIWPTASGPGDAGRPCSALPAAEKPSPWLA